MGRGPGKILETKQVDLDMGLKETGTPVPILDLSGLLSSTRWPVLPAGSSPVLQKPVALLAAACEAARAAVLRTVLGPKRQAGDGGKADQNCGFAVFFAGLRRAKPEIKCRDVAPSQLTAAAFRKSRKSALSQRALLGRAVIAARKAHG